MKLSTCLYWGGGAIGALLALLFYYANCPVHTSQCYRSELHKGLLIVFCGIAPLHLSRLVFGKLGDDPYNSGPWARWAIARGFRVFGFAILAVALGWGGGVMVLAILRGLRNLW
jgi:hypothetical protein